LATRPLPTVPAAAPTFSTTTVCPRISPIASACSRALASTPPPAANGTISVIGRVGQSCATAGVTNTAHAASAASAALVLVMKLSFAILAGVYVARRPAGQDAFRYTGTEI
jgi:hypothetical protein